jgi:hypothetical protein
MPITSNLPTSGRWDGRSATSSPFPSAGSIIASFIAVAMNAPGGGPRESIPFPLQQPFWKRTHTVDSAAADLAGDMNEPTKLNGEHLASGFGAANQHQNNETKPILPPKAG